MDTKRIVNRDEMPQFIDYGVSSSAAVGLVYCGKGERFVLTLFFVENNESKTARFLYTKGRDLLGVIVTILS